MPFWRGLRRPRASSPALAIYDDVFPCSLSGFRLTEYTEILRAYPTAAVYSTLSSLGLLGVADQADDIVADWRNHNPDVSERLHVVSGADNLPCAGAYYTVFLNNAFDLAPIVESRNARFSFTLYPGGGLALDETATSKLRRVLNSPALDQVIVTQPVVKSHLVDDLRFDPERIVYVYGVVLPPREVLPLRPAAHPLALGFAAHKYHPQGLDKGLDVFIDAVVRVASKGIPLTCHMVGPWTPADVVEIPGVRWVLHGAVDGQRLPEVLREVDVCIFPTRAGLLGPGSFDGYPTGSAIEAGLAGCLVITTNPLAQVTPLRPGRDLEEVAPDPAAVAAAVLRIVQQPAQWLDGRRWQTMQAMDGLFAVDTQMTPRHQVLRRLIELSADTDRRARGT